MNATATPIVNICGHVLVVEDDPSARALLAAALRAEGHVVVEAGNGDDALKQVRRSPPDVILLDVTMPGRDGISVCRELKQHPGTEPIPVLLVTGMKSHEDRLLGISAGANDFLAKPVDLPELILRVRNFVRMKQLYDELQRRCLELQTMVALGDNLGRMLAADNEALAKLLGTVPDGMAGRAGAMPARK